jgi:hypothetical protein
MKTILISDVGAKKESIIPYGLNFTKHIHDSINIIHVVDPRQQHANSSAYADSQSFEVGRKLSHSEVFEREKHQARLKLDKMLSKEASKLNFPLRVNTIVEQNNIKNSLSKEVGIDEPSVIISNSAFNGTNFYDFDDFLESTRTFNNLLLIVPPGYKFSIPKKILIQYDFDLGQIEGIYKVMETLKPFKSHLTVADVACANKYVELESKSTAWKQMAKDHIGEDLRITTNILNSKNYELAFLDFIRSNNYELAAFNKNTKLSSGFGFYSRNIAKHMVDKLNIPVIIY